MITVSARAETMLIRQLVKIVNGGFFYSFGKFYHVKLGQNEKKIQKKIQKKFLSKKMKILIKNMRNVTVNFCQWNA